MLNDSTAIEKGLMLQEISLLKTLGYRFIAMSCEKEGSDYELIYHFDKNYNIKNLKLTVNCEDPIPSISGIYAPAFLIENEYQDLYGFTFEGLTIDYKGNLYLTPEGPKTPLAGQKNE